MNDIGHASFCGSRTHREWSLGRVPPEVHLLVPQHFPTLFVETPLPALNACDTP